MKITLTSGHVIETLSDSLGRYVKLKHEKYGIGEGEVVPQDIRDKIILEAKKSSEVSIQILNLEYQIDQAIKKAIEEDKSK